MNCTVNDIDWPALKVAGRLPEMMLKPAPLIDAEFTVKSVVPDDVRVTVLVVAVFTVTLPKTRLLVLRASCGFAGGAEFEGFTPVPERLTTGRPLRLAVVIRVSRPLADPVTVGLN